MEHPLHSRQAHFIVTFDQEVDFLWWDGDVQLLCLNDDGTATPVFDRNNAPTAIFDTTGSQGGISLDQPLALATTARFSRRTPL